MQKEIKKVNLNLEPDTKELEAEIARLREEREAEEAKQLAEEPVPEDTDEEDVEIDNDRAALFELLEEYGIDAHQIDLIKARYGSIYTYIHNNRPYIFRGLLKREHNMVLEAHRMDKNATDDDLAFRIIKQGCVFPTFATKSELHEELAGIQNTLFELIMIGSGFLPIEAALKSVVEL